MNTETIKEALQSGTSADELIEALMQQIEDAEAEIKREKEAETHETAVDEAREAVVRALYNYMLAKGDIDEYDETEVAETVKTLKAIDEIKFDMRSLFR